MVACGISGLFGGRRVAAPLAIPVADNSLIVAVPVFADGFLPRVAVFFAVAFLVAAFAAGFFVAIFFSP
jgi:hypothetical protein